MSSNGRQVPTAAADSPDRLARTTEGRAGGQVRNNIGTETILQHGECTILSASASAIRRACARSRGAGGQGVRRNRCGVSNTCVKSPPVWFGSAAAAATTTRKVYKNRERVKRVCGECCSNPAPVSVQVCTRVGVVVVAVLPTATSH